MLVTTYLTTTTILILTVRITLQVANYTLLLILTLLYIVFVLLYFKITQQSLSKLESNSFPSLNDWELDRKLPILLFSPLLCWTVV